MAKTDRVEFRTDANRKTRYEVAAAATSESFTTFAVKALDERADQILGPGPIDVLPAEQFDALLTSLDLPPTPVPELAKAAARQRRSRLI